MNHDLGVSVRHSYITIIGKVAGAQEITMTPAFIKRTAVIGAAAAALSLAAMAPVSAAPFSASATGIQGGDSLVEKTQVRRGKPVRRKVVRVRRGNAAGAAVAAGVLGLAAGAIIAGSQSPAYADPYYAPGYYGAPGYYEAAQHYYAPSQYYADPYYGSGGTVYYNGQRYRAPRNSGEVIYNGERYRAQPRYAPQPQYAPQPRYSAQPRYAPQPQYAPQPRYRQDSMQNYMGGAADAQGRRGHERFYNDTRN